MATPKTKKKVAVKTTKATTNATAETKAKGHLKLQKATPDIQHVPLEHLLDHKQIPYRQLRPERVEALYRSLLKQGLQAPILTWAGGKSGKLKKGTEVIEAHYLVAGLHRRAAIKMLKERKVAVFNTQFKKGIPVQRYQGDLTDAIMLSLSENVNREEATVADVLPLIAHLSDELKSSAKDIANRIGAGVSTIQKVLQFHREYGVEVAIEKNLRLSDIVKVLAQLSRERGDEGAEDDKSKDKALKKVTDAKDKATKDGNQNATKRASVATVWQRITQLTNMPKGRKLTILEDAFQYLVGELDELPEELRASE